MGLRAQLVYENAENKVVEAGSKSALEYDVRVNESGAQATITCRARVNSYNLDGSLFKVMTEPSRGGNVEMADYLKFRCH